MYSLKWQNPLYPPISSLVHALSWNGVYRIQWYSGGQAVSEYTQLCLQVLLILKQNLDEQMSKWDYL